ncbi:MAG: flagellar basal-body rod protein FlgF [Bacillota bacterium]
MIRGLYTASSGMRSSMRKNNVISNNLANVNTTGFKKQTAINKSFPKEILQKIDSTSEEIGTIGSGTAIDEVNVEHSAGEFEETSNPLDFAIKGDGFFVVQTEQGERYTRNGNFTLNNQNQVVTQQGHPVRSENGLLEVPQDGEITIDDNQLMVDGQQVGQLRIRGFANKNGLVKEGENLFRRTPEAGNQINTTGVAHQGFLEGANVNPVEEMTNMIQNSRAYQLDQKVVKMNDETLNKAVNQVGKA